MSKILGLDVSSASTGYCIINNGKLIKKSMGTINPNSKFSLGQKLLFFENELIKIIEAYAPDVIIMEDIYRGPNIKTFQTLAMFRGVCFKIVFNKLGKDPICVMPTEARKLISIGPSKEDGFNFVVNKYKLPDFNFDTHNDICDAVVLGLAALEIEKRGLTKEDLRPKKKRKKRKNKK